MNLIDKKTKIIATIGPSTQDYELIKKIIKAGVSTIRANFSHGSHEEHKAKFDNAKRASEELNIPISILLDTKGPEIRVGQIENGSVQIQANSIVKILTDNDSYLNFQGNSDTLTVSYQMDQDLKIGDHVLFDDGKLTSEVIEIQPGIIYIKTINSHILKSNKRINLPGVEFSLPFLSEKDKNDVLFGIENKVDYIAASFVNSANNVYELRDLLDTNGGKNIQIISKIESRIGIEKIDEIIEASDGVMIARGDLGLEIPFQDVPYYEKLIIRKCRSLGKPVIVATQMLDSMENSPHPTRAEVTDVYLAVELGSDSTMLSGESAQGKFPLESVEVMATISKRAEKEFYNKLFYSIQLANVAKKSTGERARIAHKIAFLTMNDYYRFTVVLSRTGRLLKKVAMFRPNTAIIGIINDIELIGSFGITSSVFVSKDSIDLFSKIKQNPHYAKNALIPFGAKPGDKFLIVENEKIIKGTF
ncbi:pyruvate kinase [Mesomycoplasma neurolyticum]|uniref:Pyruvate kinase n=1 Tax=Mesomycoplasma neurolyticum TaxID=2120 RepID=A0A449A4Q2_9BACT|nr:pyruvate kinase [Mesomycoplasma neurolyticum]VEU59202.1 pyruvate kinase [Mesomycoplasma neurolyticum]